MSAQAAFTRTCAVRFPVARVRTVSVWAVREPPIRQHTETSTKIINLMTLLFEDAFPPDTPVRGKTQHIPAKKTNQSPRLSPGSERLVQTCAAPLLQLRKQIAKIEVNAQQMPLLTHLVQTATQKTTTIQTLLDLTKNWLHPERTLIVPLFPRHCRKFAPPSPSFGDCTARSKAQGPLFRAPRAHLGANTSHPRSNTSAPPRSPLPQANASSPEASAPTNGDHSLPASPRRPPQTALPSPRPAR